ncbi:MAG: hypothetical protein LAT68_08550 [Cyclobacteriaceae bacterium]|nr:hypothetical protein [Cyclobacteriaceae bacterium]MCH8516366.1 hypothetical protein [Cyclobacteriaceae bacterium]
MQQKVLKKEKLKKFKTFVASLLPHETAYLLKIEQLEDESNRLILNQTHLLVSRQADDSIFSHHIDKRKYSRMIRWMQDKLAAGDVDLEFNRLINLERRLMHDQVNAEDETELLKLLKVTNTSDYYFMKRFELAMHLMNYLLVRMRHKEYMAVSEFIGRFKTHYDHCRHVYGRIQEATLDITSQYSFHDKDSSHWENWLLTIFRDPMMDGMNRYYALVRLIFLYYNYNQKDQLKLLFDEVEPLLESGKFYSRRILINYYGNRLLFHSKNNEIDLAIKYGYLSLRVENSDYLYYLNNLVAVLQKRGKHESAIELMQSSFSEASKSHNFHHRVSFVSAYIRSLTDSGQPIKAVRHAEVFLDAYKSELFQYRWHLFFTLYFRALCLSGADQKVLQALSKYRLQERESRYLSKISSVATLDWYAHIAAYRLGEIELKELINYRGKFLALYETSTVRSKAVKELLDDLNLLIPEVANW